jgi:hypothetical protein
VYAIDLLSQGLTAEYSGFCAESSRSPRSVRFPFRNPRPCSGHGLPYLASA